MLIAFQSQEGQFRPAVRNAIEQNAGKFPVKVKFRSRGGASGRIRVSLDEYTFKGFETDWKGKDPTRFAP